MFTIVGFSVQFRQTAHFPSAIVNPRDRQSPDGIYAPPGGLISAPSDGSSADDSSHLSFQRVIHQFFQANGCELSGRESVPHIPFLMNFCRDYLLLLGQIPGSLQRVVRLPADYPRSLSSSVEDQEEALIHEKGQYTNENSRATLHSLRCSDSLRKQD